MAISDPSKTNYGVDCNYQYISPTPGRFPIIAWEPIPLELKNNNVTNAQLKEIISSLSDAGFNCFLCNNFAYSTSSTAEMRLFNMAPATVQGIKFIIGFNSKSVTQTASTINALLSNFNNAARIGAWQIMDQPQYVDWKDRVTVFTQKYFNTVATDSAHMAVFNMAATTTDSAYLGLLSDYYSLPLVMQYRFSPGVWSFDYYPSSICSSSTVTTVAQAAQIPIKKSITLKTFGHFIYFLKRYSDIAVLTNRPFWAYCMCANHYQSGKTTEFSIYFPTPTLGILRVEALTALALGAQGIVYYRATLGDSHYLEAPLGKRGSSPLVKTPVYERVKQINEFIEKHKAIFLGSVLQQSALTDMEIEGIDKLKIEGKPFGCLSSVKAEMIIPADDEKSGYDALYIKGVMVTLLQNGNDNYTVIMNTNAFYAQNVTFAVSLLYSYEILAKYDWIEDAESKQEVSDNERINIGGGTVQPVLPNQHTLKLGPGEMRIIKYALNKEDI